MGDVKQPRLTLASLKVLRVFLESPKQLAGADIQKLGRVPTGTLYPILLRFEAAGWLDSKWEDIDPKEAGRPRRRFYWLTPTGFARAKEALSYLGSEVPALGSEVQAWR
jgi:PadR family transcriptional regulator, regulatory protein PadR